MICAWRSNGLGIKTGDRIYRLSPCSGYLIGLRYDMMISACLLVFVCLNHFFLVEMLSGCDQ